MCGILGQLAYGEGAPDAADLSELVAGMKRRGPDSEGLWTDDRKLIFGMRRLAVVDPSPYSDQPMVDGSTRSVLVYNGELYNHEALRRELERAGVRFRSRGDTEVVLRALVHWGREALPRFNGMFAFGFYDGVRGRLLLARDHAGIKPLYYVRSGRGVFFASQYDQILAHRWGREGAVSPDALASYLRLGHVLAPGAMLEGTHAVPAGGWVEFSLEGTERGGRWFEFDPLREPDLRGADADEAVDAAIAGAVRRQMMSDVPIGAFLSGGVDSPLVAAAMTAQGDGPVSTFTLGSADPGHDEAPEARTYAEAIGSLHREAQLGPDDANRLVDDSVAACGEPLADATIPVLALCERAREHVTVLLSGDGGDELFWGYPRSLWILGRLEDLTDRNSRVSRLLTIEDRDEGLVAGGVGAAQRMFQTAGSEGWLRALFPGIPPLSAARPLFDHRGTDPDAVARFLRWNEFEVYLPKMLLKTDRASMYHSIEVRVPLLDREVIETALRVDWRSCLDPRRKLGKLPLRNALSRHVGRHTLPKRGFSLPMGDWFRGPLRTRAEEALLGRGDLLGLELERGSLRRLWDLHLSRKSDFGQLLWTLVNLALWQERHGL